VRNNQHTYRSVMFYVEKLAAKCTSTKMFTTEADSYDTTEDMEFAAAMAEFPVFPLDSPFVHIDVSNGFGCVAFNKHTVYITRAQLKKMAATFAKSGGGTAYSVETSNLCFCHKMEYLYLYNLKLLLPEGEECKAIFFTMSASDAVNQLFALANFRAKVIFYMREHVVAGVC
jgi:hypothetical protein